MLNVLKIGGGRDDAVTFDSHHLLNASLLKLTIIEREHVSKFLISSSNAIRALKLDDRRNFKTSISKAYM